MKSITKLATLPKLRQLIFKGKLIIIITVNSDGFFLLVEGFAIQQLCQLTNPNVHVL